MQGNPLNYLQIERSRFTDLYKKQYNSRMFSSRTTKETILYVLAVLIAFGLRFVNLGALPLTDFEASWALQSLHVADGLKPAIGANPAFVHLTAVLFFVFGSTNFLARFWSALAGTLLILAPLFFRDRLGRIPALLLAFFLACDPGLLAFARMAGSSILAVTAVVFTCAFWRTERRTAAGVCAALALLSGPGVWFGLFGLALAWVIGMGIQAVAGKIAGGQDAGTGPMRIPWETLRGPVSWGAGTLLIAGTLFLISPKGLAGILSALGGFASGWWTPSGVPVLRLLAALPAYALMPLGFGLAAVVRGAIKRDPLPVRLGLWALAAFLLGLAYPARQVGDLIWMLLPLWILASLELSLHFDFEKVGAWEVGGVTMLVVAILTFAWLDFASVAGAALNTSFGQLRMLLFAGALVLVALILVLVSMGWSKDLARIGGVWGAAIMLAIYTLGAATGAGGLRQPRTVELWNPSLQIMDADLLIKTADQISDWSKGTVESLPVVISGVDSPALLWLFRDWDVSAEIALSPVETPALVVTPAGEILNQAAAYRGEAFLWRQTPLWVQAAVPDWTRWYIYHKFPTTNETIILWVRGDLLIDSQDQTINP